VVQARSAEGRALPDLFPIRQAIEIMTVPRRSFYFHYNKPASQAAGEPRLSIHWNNRCMIAKGINCEVNIRSRNRSTQPRCVMAGKAARVVLDSEGIAHIYNS